MNNSITTILSNFELCDPKTRRVLLQDLEKACKAIENENGVYIEPTHYHANGVYAREVYIPAGTALVGEIHKHDVINVVSKGVIQVATESEGVRIIEAPLTFVSVAGTKRAGLVLEDTIWTTFHATTSTNQEEIKKEVIADSYDMLDTSLENKL